MTWTANFRLEGKLDVNLDEKFKMLRFISCRECWHRALALGTLGLCCCTGPGGLCVPGGRVVSAQIRRLEGMTVLEWLASVQARRAAAGTVAWRAGCGQGVRSKAS